MGSKRANRKTRSTESTHEERWRLQEEARLHILDKRPPSTKAPLNLTERDPRAAWLRAISWLVQAEEQLWQVRGVQFIYPGAAIHITAPEIGDWNLGDHCYTKVKWNSFRKQYKTESLIRAAADAAVDSEGTATWVDTYRSDVPRLSGKGGCMVGATFMTSPSKGTHISFKFRAAEFTWRHVVDWIMVTRLCQLATELPRPITVHLFYTKLFLNTMFLPMLVVPLGPTVHEELMEKAYPRLYRQWHNNWCKFMAPQKKGWESKVKMKAILRAMKWTRGEIAPGNIPVTELNL